MPALMLVLTIVSATVQSFFTKIFSKKTERGVFFFNAMSALIALPVFLVSAKFQFTFLWENFLYSVLFALSYFFAVFGLTMAIKTGPLSITALIESYSVILAAIYGIVFLHEPITLCMIIGFVLLILSLTLVNYEKKTAVEHTEQAEELKAINGKWLFFVSVGFVGNGCCMIVKKMQQVWSENTFGEGIFLYGNELMIMGLLIAFVALMVCAFVMEKKDVKEVFRLGWAPAIGRGLSNGLANLFSLSLMAMMAVSLANALLAAGCVILSALISVSIYKEKLNVWQWVGLGIGILSLVFLNL